MYTVFFPKPHYNEVRNNVIFFAFLPTDFELNLELWASKLVCWWVKYLVLKVQRDFMFVTKCSSEFM
jgi:hypothetical protein